MESVEILTLENAARWREVLPASRHVFGSAEYVGIASRRLCAKAFLFLFKSTESILAYPFYARTLEALPFLAGKAMGFCDIQSPEYSGPMALGHTTRDCLSNFADAFHAYCVDEGIVSEFSRLHPWRCASEALEAGCVTHNREIVYVDLEQSLEDIWSHSLNHQCRGGIRKAEREGVKILLGIEKETIVEFFRIYSETMSRRQASEKYRFPLSYFESFARELPHNSTFVLATYEGRAIAGSLYLFDDQDAYAFLGGMDWNYQEVRSRNKLIFEMIKWSKANGKKRLVLGGGFQANDGVFKFKASFSSHRAPFEVYKRVHMSKVYRQLCTAFAEHFRVDCGASPFFPSYRTPIDVAANGDGAS